MVEEFSDAESIQEVVGVLPPLPIVWTGFLRDVSEYFIFYDFVIDPHDASTLTSERFASNVGMMVDYVKSLYPYPNRITCMIVPASSVDQDGMVHEFDLRFDPEFIFQDDFVSEFTDYVQTYTAPIWIRAESNGFSDSVTGKIVVYKISYVRFCVEKVDLSQINVTKIVGDQTIHPGIYVKKIDYMDHDVEYLEYDCLFACLNEATGQRHSPIDIRAQIWPDVDKKDLKMKQIHRSRHFIKVCQIYGISLQVFNVDERKQYRFGGGGNIVRIVKVGRVVGLYGRQETVQDSINIDENSHLYCYFDLETVQKDGELQRIYAYCIKTSTGFEEAVCDSDIDVVEKLLVSAFLSILSRIPHKECAYVYAWNGSRFDFRIIIPLFARRRVKCRNIIINSANELLSFSVFMDGHGSIHFRDPCKLFPETLTNAAKIFNVGMAKGEVDHNKIEEAYNSDTWNSFVEENRCEILAYVCQDVYMLESIVGKIRNLYCDNTHNLAIPMHICISRSMASYMIWRKHMPKHIREILPNISKGPYDTVQTYQGNVLWTEIYKDAVAGRVQTPQGKCHYKSCAMLDIKSQYPYVSSHRYFPAGDTVPTSIHIKDKLGMYKLRIIKQNTPMIIPHRISRLKAYEWAWNDAPFEKWVTSIDVEELISNGAIFEILDGFIWTSKTEDYFNSFMNILFELRNNTSKGSPFNTHYKIIMNAITGSIFQKTLREYTLMCSKDEFDTMLKKYSSVISVVNVWEIDSNANMCIFRPLKLTDKRLIEMQKEICSKAIISRPAILTMFIYSYARQWLLRGWNTVESTGKCKVIYCDTDSLIFTNASHGIELMRNKGFIGKELGSWDIEYDNAECIIVKPKIYAIRQDSKDDKIRIKGVSSSAYCTFNEDTTYTRETSFKTLGKIYREKYLFGEGASFEHVKKIYDGNKMYVHYWQMNKKLDGVLKTYTLKILDA